MTRLLRDRARERAADHAAERGATQPGRAARERAPAALGLGAGVALPARERAYFERRLRSDLSGVRIHPESRAAASLGARAFAAGRDIGFAPGRWQPQTAEGRRLLGHELAHVVQQGAHGPAVQLDEEEKQEDKPKEASEEITKGLKKVAEEAQKNEQVKKQIIEPAKKYALRRWDRLGTPAQATVISLGAVGYGVGLGTALSSDKGQELLEGTNIALPFKLLPYGTLTGLEYTLPKGPTDPTLIKTSFDGADLLDLAHRKISWFPKLSLTVDMTWAVDPEGRVTLPKGRASLGFLGGFKLQLGTDIGLGWKPLPTAMGPLYEPGPPLEGAATTLQGPGVFLSVDLLKLDILPKQLRQVLGAPVKKE